MIRAIIFMAAFAAFWWIAGLYGAQLPAGLYAVGPILSAVLILAARQRLKDAAPQSPDEARRTSRVVGWAAGGEGLAIALAANLMTRNGLGPFLLPAIAIIVGLHFLPLAILLKVRIYYATALLIILTGLAGLALDASYRALATGLTAAALLWLTCLYRLATEAPSPTAARTA